eukprot:scaffold354157_cov25-Prasinocladus_malaysianus.AAC.2
MESPDMSMMTVTESTVCPLRFDAAGSRMLLMYCEIVTCMQQGIRTSRDGGGRNNNNNDIDNRNNDDDDDNTIIIRRVMIII